MEAEERMEDPEERKRKGLEDTSWKIELIEGEQEIAMDVRGKAFRRK